MTRNQIAYQEHLVNKAALEETKRSNVVKETETQRHNVITENLSERQLDETIANNLRNFGVNVDKLNLNKQEYQLAVDKYNEGVRQYENGRLDSYLQQLLQGKYDPATLAAVALLYPVLSVLHVGLTQGFSDSVTRVDKPETSGTIADKVLDDVSQGSDFKTALKTQAHHTSVLPIGQSAMNEILASNTILDMAWNDYKAKVNQAEASGLSSGILMSKDASYAQTARIPMFRLTSNHSPIMQMVDQANAQHTVSSKLRHIEKTGLRPEYAGGI